MVVISGWAAAYLISSLAATGVAAYSAHQQAKAYEGQAKEAKKSRLAMGKKFKKDERAREEAAKQSRLEFDKKLETLRFDTRERTKAAEAAVLATRQATEASEKTSRLAIQRADLAAALAAKQAEEGRITTKTRKKYGTPANMRTKLEIDSGLSGLGGTGDVA